MIFGGAGLSRTTSLRGCVEEDDRGEAPPGQDRAEGQRQEGFVGPEEGRQGHLPEMLIENHASPQMATRRM